MLRPSTPLLALLARPPPPSTALLRVLIPTLFPARALSTSQSHFKIVYPPRLKPPPESEIQESYLKGSGPGGQKINKTNSAVQLTHLPTGLVVKCQSTRSRSQNRKIARDLLATKIDDYLHRDVKKPTTKDPDVETPALDEGDVVSEGDADRVDERKGKGLRTAAEPGAGMARSAFVAEVKRKKKASAAKKSKRKHKAAAEAKVEAMGDSEEGISLDEEGISAEEKELRSQLRRSLKAHGYKVQPGDVEMLMAERMEDVMANAEVLEMDIEEWLAYQEKDWADIVEELKSLERETFDPTV